MVLHGLEKLISFIPVEPCVEQFVSDFEAAVWKAVRKTFGRRIKMIGCVFHWSQAVWRRLVDLGIGPAYRKKVLKRTNFADA